MSSNHLILCRPLLLLPSVLPSIRVFSSESALRITWAKVLEFQLQHHSFQRTPRTDLLQNGLVGSPCRPRDSQESSPTPQFKSINSLVLSFLYSPTLVLICGIAFLFSTTDLTLIFMFFFHCLSVFKEAQPCQCSKIKRSYQGKWSSLFYLWVHEGESLPAH